MGTTLMMWAKLLLLHSSLPHEGGHHEVNGGVLDLLLDYQGRYAVGEQGDKVQDLKVGLEVPRELSIGR